MKLNEILDDNGTSIQSHIEVLVDRLRDKALRYVLVVLNPSGDDRQDIAVTTNVDGAALPKALRTLARHIDRAGPETRKVEVPS